MDVWSFVMRIIGLGIAFYPAVVVMRLIDLGVAFT